MASPPLIMTPVNEADVRRGDGAIVTEFVEGYCRITKESLGGSAGTLLQMRNWQRNITSCVYARRADGRLCHRQALIGLPRKNGKSALGSSMALHALINGGVGAEVYSCAVDKDQARIVFGVAKRMVQMDPLLDADQGGIIKVWRDALEYTETGSLYKVLSSEAITKEGLNPTAVIYDELHGAPTPELYDVMTLAMGARRDPILIAITTAGKKGDRTGQDSICYQLYQHGVRIANGETEDPSFFMAWFGAPENADFRDPEVWKAANPGFGDLIDPEDFASSVRRVHEGEFRTKRLNQWVSSIQAWLPQGAWEACRTSRDFVTGARGVVLGFDGSDNGDCTALVAITVDSDPMVKVLGLWQKPADADSDWRVPRGEVKDAIRQACHDYVVRELACDEYLWRETLEELEAEGIPVVAFPQTLNRMAPATQRMYEMVQDRAISHDGNPNLARHFENCTIKTDSRGSRIVKDRKGSPRKIDLAVATVMAMDRAAFFLTEPVEPVIGDGRTTVSSHAEKGGFVWGNSDARISAGEKCDRCGNPIIKWPDGSPRLTRIGMQVVCTPPCGSTPDPKPEPQQNHPDNPQTYSGYLVN